MTSYTPTVDPSVLSELHADIGQLVAPILRPPISQRIRLDRRRITRWRALPALPCLLDQLRQATQPGGTTRGPERHSMPRSRPPGNLDAMQALARLYVELSGWHTHLRLPSPPRHLDWHKTALHQLDEAARHAHPDDVHKLAGDVHSWWRTAARHSGLSPDELRAWR